MSPYRCYPSPGAIHAGEGKETGSQPDSSLVGRCSDKAAPDSERRGETRHPALIHRVPGLRPTVPVGVRPRTTVYCLSILGLTWVCRSHGQSALRERRANQRSETYRTVPRGVSPGGPGESLRWLLASLVRSPCARQGSLPGGSSSRPRPDRLSRLANNRQSLPPSGQSCVGRGCVRIRPWRTRSPTLRSEGQPSPPKSP